MRPAFAMKMLSQRLVATLATLVLAAAALSCSGEERPAYARSADRVRGVTIVDPVTTPYTPVAVTAGGTITGTVRFSGDAPQDSTITITRDERVCGNTLRQITVQTNGDLVQGALVWIADIRTGRALPLARRFELVQTRCTFGPIAQVATAGGTLNVRTHDPVLTQLAVVDTRTLDTLVILPFNSPGSLVPLDTQLRRPAMLEVRSVTHPWMQAWVAVLDHPYHATSGRDGAFQIEEIPQGSYQVKAWHPRFGMTTASAVVRAGAATRVELVFGRASDSSRVARASAAPHR